MENKDEYLTAWSEEEGGTPAVDPVVESVKAARKAEADEFADAFTNDNFGLDVEKVAKKGDELIEKDEEKKADA